MAHDDVLAERVRLALFRAWLAFALAFVGSLSRKQRRGSTFAGHTAVAPAARLHPSHAAR
jgi:hypothetical protein